MNFNGVIFVRLEVIIIQAEERTKSMKIDLIDICSGIGGFPQGLKQAGFTFGEEYYAEIDKNAERIYKRHFPNAQPLGDITAVDPNRFICGPENDFFITGGFPCQSFSIAGKRSGFEDTRGTIFFDIARIAKHVRPKYMLLENVKGLLSHDEGRTFKTIIRTLDELRIFETIEWFVFNSKNHGVAQNRERICIFCSRKGSGRQVLLEREKVKRSVEGSTATTVVRTLTAGGHSGGLHSGMTLLSIGDYRKDCGFRWRKDGSSPTIMARSREDVFGQPVITIPVLTPDRPEKRQNGRRFKNNNDHSFTITAQDKHGIYNGKTIRRLTPLECERLQGFPDGWTKEDSVHKKMSDSSRYKACGNAVTVNVIEHIGRNILKAV